MTEKEAMPEMPKWLQNAVKAIYIVGFSMLLFIAFVVVAFFIGAPLDDATYSLGLYAGANAIIMFLFLNENLRIEKVRW